MCELINNDERGAATAKSGGTSNPYTQMLNHGKKKAVSAQPLIWLLGTRN